MASKKKNEPGSDVRAARARAMNPLLAALEASGLVTAESAAAARGPSTRVGASSGERIANAVAAGKIVGMPAEEQAVLEAERACGLTFPNAYRRWLLVHGPTRIATEPPTTFTPLAELAEVTRTWWAAHRSLAALKQLHSVIERSVLISNHLDDRAIAMLACEGPMAGQVFVIAHDADVEPTPEPFDAWLAALLE